MKKTIINLSYKLIILMGCLTGCNTNDIVIDDSVIRFFTTIEHPDERVTSNNFESGDQIGVFVVPYEADNVTPGVLGQSQYANNREHVYGEGFWEAATGNLIPWLLGRNIDIYAYHPYDAGLTDPRAYIFNVSSDQSVRSGYVASDFLYARDINLSQASSVPLVFSHALSKVNINVRSDIVLVKNAMDQTTVHLQNIAGQCIIDLGTGSAYSGSSTTTAGISAYRLNTPVTGYDLSMTAVIPPQRVPGSVRILRINNMEVDYVYTTDQELIFEQGYTLTFNIEITLQGIIVTTSAVSGWSDGGSISGNIGERPDRVFDLDAIDWNQSYVHYIYDDNSLIGQVCREYIYRNSNPTVDIPAIVVYPLGTDGSMDLTRGFVARVYNRARNSNNEYYLNQDAVHGGRAVFGTGNALSSYVQGSSPLINKVRIQSADAISGVPDDAIPTLSVRPYTLTDIDNNIYPVTKISSQYWIRTNYRAERYTNGEPLPHYYYNNDPGYKDKYGALYIWQTTVNSAGFVPDGWRVPTRTDWNNLSTYTYPGTGTKIKALNEWIYPAYADDVTGFNGLAGGRRVDNGAYTEMGSWGQWWSSTQSSNNNAWRYYVGTGSTITENSLSKSYAESVRLMRDN